MNHQFIVDRVGQVLHVIDNEIRAIVTRENLEAYVRGQSFEAQLGYQRVQETLERDRKQAEELAKADFTEKAPGLEALVSRMVNEKLATMSATAPLARLDPFARDPLPRDAKGDIALPVVRDAQGNPITPGVRDANGNLINPLPGRVVERDASGNVVTRDAQGNVINRAGVVERDAYGNVIERDAQGNVIERDGLGNVINPRVYDPRGLPSPA